MAYHGLIGFAKQRLADIIVKGGQPSVLEVGVDRGVTFFSIAAFLARTGKPFGMIGVDVMVQEQVRIVLQNLDFREGQEVYLAEKNSLEVLPELVESGTKFDVIFIDGDHNYYTVSKELEHIEAMSHPWTVVIIDDYNGRWSDRDMFYADRPGYEGNQNVTPEQKTEKHGVKAAVDEWLEKNPGWVLHNIVQGEPVVLARIPTKTEASPDEEREEEAKPTEPAPES